MNLLIMQCNLLQPYFLLSYEKKNIFNEPKIEVRWDMKPVSVGSYCRSRTAVCLHIHDLSSTRTSLSCLELNIEITSYSETAITIYQWTRRHTP